MSLRPRHIVAELDKFIVGQADAKKAVAIALRNRWRRAQVAAPLQAEITPKNILMIGPTGVGKTEIARRLAGLVNAPFLKVEATKFTEVGYVGRDVDAIIRDLTEVAIRERRTAAMEEVKDKAAQSAEEKVLDLLLPSQSHAENSTASVTRDRLREKLRAGEMSERELEVEVTATPMQMEIVSPPGMEEMTSQLQGMFKNILGGRRKSQRMKVREALGVLAQEEAARLVNEEEIRLQAVKSVEQSGIVFLDEIDKVTSRSESQGADVSRQGVQRDLLPLVEGTSVNTRYGPVNTDHILFIASGAFHFSKPSDLIPELQGRFPVRVELKPLTIEDFEHILTKTDACLTWQYQSLMATEGVKLVFENEAVRRLAEMAHAVNEHTENIGARRLYAMMENLLEDIAFEAGEDAVPKTIHINVAYVEKRLADAAANEDLARYIL